MIHLEVYHEADLTSMFVKSVLSVICQKCFVSDFVNVVTHSARWPISQVGPSTKEAISQGGPSASWPISHSGMSARVACQPGWPISQGGVQEWTFEVDLSSPVSGPFKDLSD